MNSWHSYPSIYNLGHRAIEGLLSRPVQIEEKVDGSQFSFGIDEFGELHFRSKGAQLVADAPEKMFALAVKQVRERESLLTPGWTYRGEYLQKPKHNSLAYGRVPIGNIILFDVNTAEESYLPYESLSAEAVRIDFECIPILHCGLVAIEQIDSLLRTQSVLGGGEIEGIVIKPLARDFFGLDKKLLMGKFVSERFKEIHAHEWRKSNPTKGDILDQLSERYRSMARWEKAVQHLREAGKLDESVRDIGPLMVEVPLDIEKECADEIKESLFRYAWPRIRRSSVAGLPEWYKRKLAGLPTEAETTETVAMQ